MVVACSVLYFPPNSRYYFFAIIIFSDRRKQLVVGIASGPYLLFFESHSNLLVIFFSLDE